MKDFLGNELNPGDEVIFIYSNLTGGRKLVKGVVDKMDKGNIFIKGLTYGVYDNPPTSTRIDLFGQVKVKPRSIYKIK